VEIQAQEQIGFSLGVIFITGGRSASDASCFHVLADGFTVNSDRLLKLFSDASQEVIKRTIVLIP